MTLKQRIRLQQAQEQLNRNIISTEQFEQIKVECTDSAEEPSASAPPKTPVEPVGAPTGPKKEKAPSKPKGGGASTKANKNQPPAPVPQQTQEPVAGSGTAEKNEGDQGDGGSAGGQEPGNE